MAVSLGGSPVNRGGLSGVVSELESHLSGDGQTASFRDMDGNGATIVSSFVRFQE